MTLDFVRYINEFDEDTTFKIPKTYTKEYALSVIKRNFKLKFEDSIIEYAQGNKKHIQEVNISNGITINFKWDPIWNYPFFKIHMINRYVQCNIPFTYVSINSIFVVKDIEIYT